MLHNYIKQILSLYNYVDAIIMVNEKGIIEYSDNFRTDLNNLYTEEVVGRYIWEVYPMLNEKNSSLLKALKSGSAIINESQHLINFKGVDIEAVNSTFPIKSGEKVIGAVEVSMFLESDKRRNDISLKLKEKDNNWSNYDICDIITNDPYMNSIKSNVLKISKTDSPVLIYGHTGTGKEMIARSIHNNSKRMSKPFISQNCAAIPATLLESILFGTVKGSYTGAENRMGLFEAADGGTLFLDEINSMEISMQPKLLKAIENQEIRRIGTTESKKVNVRIITAVNEPPSEIIKEKKLREDLFYRIGVVQINLPDLKNRKKDIRVLCDHYVKEYNKIMEKNIKGLHDSVYKILENYSWPGNIRELKNIIESAFNITCSDVIKVEDLPDYIFDNNRENDNKLGFYYDGIGKNTKSLTERVENYEKKLIIEALKTSKNTTDAAKLLKISRQSLNYKMQKYFIDDYYKD